MSYVKVSANTNGTGVFTLASPNSNTDRVILLPDATDTLVGITATQTLTNKTLSTGTKINTSGSDGSGDMYYRDSSGNLKNFSVIRDKKLRQDVHKLVHNIALKYKPQKIVLFGSMARGDYHEGSDIDLMLIKDVKNAIY